MAKTMKFKVPSAGTVILKVEGGKIKKMFTPAPVVEKPEKPEKPEEVSTSSNPVKDWFLGQGDFAPVDDDENNSGSEIEIADDEED